MRLSEFIVDKALIENLESKDKNGVIKEMVEALVQAKAIKKAQAASVIKALLDREKLGSTGIGQGVAVPHAKHKTVSKVIGAFGRSKGGVEFNALDGEPVHAVFLLISPEDSPGPHLRALAHISKLIRDNTFCRFLKEAKNLQELQELLEEADERF